ncbi:MAG TPA: LacI family DNA-binding transcriptional regulator [Lachnospiraceae bacterium]|nr:LacI family DNA-binding transcriptional regulator [Lachnospiraceae bacterium]
MFTIKDVAERAGVSIATVSRIMNKPDVVSEKTQKKVYKVMEELNYQPNAMARALQQKKSNIIGLVLPMIDYAFFSRLTDAIEEECHSYGYKLMLCKSGEHEEREKEMFSILQANKVDGILVCSRLGDASLFTNFDFPVVSIEREIEKVPSVTSDNYQGGSIAAQELIAAGCRVPAVFGAEVPDYFPGTKRIQGFRDEYAKIGLEIKECLANKEAIGHKGLEDIFYEYIKNNTDIDGLFIMGDMMAAQILSSERAYKMDIKNKIPIVSFDGFEISEWMQLSTVVQPIREVGECAVELLVRKIEGKVAPERSVLPVKLIKRESTKKFK